MRVYRPVEKKLFTCICGCNRSRRGNAHAKYYEPACRHKAHLVRSGNEPYLKGTTYASYVSMRTRCLNPNQVGWKYYGGRGITICERWNNFQNFLEDMGPRPEGKTIDRINNEGNYEPGNCRWATPVQQADNRRNSRTTNREER